MYCTCTGRDRDELRFPAKDLYSPVRKSPQGCSTSDFFSFKLKNQCDETFIDNLLLSVLLMVTCFDSPALSLWQCRFVLVKQDILSEY